MAPAGPFCKRIANENCVPEFRSLRGRSLRPPTSAELVQLAELREAGVAEVYLEPEQAPPEFWENISQATFQLLTSEGSHWDQWQEEVLLRMCRSTRFA